MSETNKPDTIQASVEWQGMTVQVHRDVGDIDSLVIEIETPSASIVLEGPHARWLKHGLYGLCKALD